MKKENKQLAQKHKAEARKKQNILEKIGLVCKIGIPTLLIILLIAGCIIIPLKLSDDSSTSYTVNTSYKIKDGDIVNIDYVGSVDGEVFQDTKGAGTKLAIGSNIYVDGFEEQLIGAQVGSTVEVNVTFPEDYTEELGGKDATFQVTINGVYEQ